MDILLSGVALIITSPFMLVTAIAIKAYDGGPVMFKQKRMTLDRKVFEIHKFRSMKVDADKGGKGIVTMQNDDRITPVGKVIRACRLDELPQLYDIFIGNMTIVGPRPERLGRQLRLYEKEMPEFGMRLQVKAGLTGYAQVYGKANTSPYDKLQMDLMYIGEQSVIHRPGRSFLPRSKFFSCRRAPRVLLRKRTRWARKKKKSQHKGRKRR